MIEKVIDHRLWQRLEYVNRFGQTCYPKMFIWSWRRSSCSMERLTFAEVDNGV